MTWSHLRIDPNLWWVTWKWMLTKTCQLPSSLEKIHWHDLTIRIFNNLCNFCFCLRSLDGLGGLHVSHMYDICILFTAFYKCLEPVCLISIEFLGFLFSKQCLPIEGAKSKGLKVMNHKGLSNNLPLKKKNLYPPIIQANWIIGKRWSHLHLRLKLFTPHLFNTLFNKTSLTMNSKEFNMK